MSKARISTQHIDTRALGMGFIVVHNSLEPELSLMAARLRDTRPMMAVAGNEMRMAYAEHFRNKRPFYQTEIARYLVGPALTPTTAEITVGGTGGPMLLHKISGGRVYGKTSKGKMLAIPARPEAKKAGWPRDGKTPPLKVIVWQGGNRAALVEDVSLKVSGRGARRKWTAVKPPMRVWYWLVKSVYHRPDPTALPDKLGVDARIIARMREWYAGVLAGDTARAQAR